MRIKTLCLKNSRSHIATKLELADSTSYEGQTAFPVSTSPERKFSIPLAKKRLTKTIALAQIVGQCLCPA
jgi:hypothetical protein